MEVLYFKLLAFFIAVGVGLLIKLEYEARDKYSTPSPKDDPDAT